MHSRRASRFLRGYNLEETAFVHRCELPPPDDLVERYICNGWFVYLRRKIKRYQMCSEDNARTKLFFKSMNAIFGEKYKHLEYDFNMIHPFSIGRAHWETFMMIIFFVVLLYIPINVCAFHQLIAIDTVKVILDSICLLDIVMSFWTGYQHPLTKRVIMHRKMVIRHYMMSWFPVDILTSLNQDIIVVFVYRYAKVNIWYIRMISMIKILRIRTVLQYVTQFKEWHQFSWFTHQVITMSMVLVMVIIWSSSILYLVAWHYNEVWLSSRTDVFTGLKSALSRTVGCLLIIGEGGNKSATLPVFTLEVLYTITGWILRLIITSQIALIIMKRNPLRTNYERIVQEFQDYMAIKHLPKLIKRRVMAYLELMFRKKFFKERLIYRSLSNRLKQEINVYICKNFLVQTPLFLYLPDEVIIRLSEIMEQQVYLPNDVIISVDSPFENAIFITAGMIAVYDRNGKEVKHLKEGESYGEIYLFVNEPRCLDTIVAIDYCEIYAMNQTKFKKALSPYPEIWARLAKFVRLTFAESEILNVISTIAVQSLTQFDLHKRQHHSTPSLNDEETLL